MSDTVVITSAVDKPLIGKSSAIQWPGVRTGLQTATASADGIKSMMFTYRFMEDEPAVFTDVQGGEAEPCAGGRASINTVDSAVKATSTDEGRAADDDVPTVDREIMAYAHGLRGHAAEVCPEALMAGNYVVYHDDINDKGPVVRLLQWVAGICGGSWDFAVHASIEAQLMAGNEVLYQNGFIQWLLR